MPIRIVKGLDIPIDCAPEQTITPGPDMASVALLGDDYIGLSPAMRVAEGDRVKLGQPLFADRRRPAIVFTAPASGIVAAINRGARRALRSVVVRIDGDDRETFPSWPEEQLVALRRDQVGDALRASGLWTALRARPFGRVADPDATPSSIFVTALDSNPLAPRPETVIDSHRRDFANGLIVIAHLTDGTVFLCQSPGSDLPAGASDKVSVAAFSGPHPAGLVGTHIHFLDPVGAKRTVWHIGYQDVIAIGKLFTTGRLWVERVVALAGPPVRRPRLIRTRLGASTDALVDGEIDRGEATRIVSGSVLSGRLASGADAYLGRYHNQLSVIAEAGAARGRGFSAYSLAVSGRPARRRFALTAAAHGHATALVPLGGFERVMPLDILPTPLLRALLVGDTDMAQALGCLELEEEDLALCAFLCPGKLDYGPLLRDALNRIEKDG